VPGDGKAYDVALFLILADRYTGAVPEELQIALAELCVKIEASLSNISRFRWYAMTLDEMSARQWLDTDQLFLEDLTLAGRRRGRDLALMKPRPEVA